MRPEFATRYGSLAVVLMVAVALRLSGLTEWWLNPDEGIYYSILTRETFAGFWDEVASNAHPPLYYLLLRGLGVLTWDFLWFRVFTLLCGLAAVWATWAAARSMTGRGVRGTVAGAVAGLVLATAPGAVELSQVIRPYMLQVALLAGALVFLLRYLDAPRDGVHTAKLVGYVTLVLLALLTHYSSALALAAFGLVVLEDGIRHGTGRRAWRALFAVHAVPALALALIYVVHLRGLMDSALATDALDGWLDPYMVGSPGDAWLGFMGFQHLVAIPWLRGATAVLMLAAVITPLIMEATTGSRRDNGSDGSATPDRLRPAVLMGSGFAVALAASAVGAYPFGSTRHSAWLLVFGLPALGWVVAWAVVRPKHRAAPAIAILLLLVAASGPLGGALGESRAPWSPTERVLRQASLTQVVDLLDPGGSPELLVMSAQTFYLLLPFYPTEREQATRSEEDGIFHFRMGERQVLVSDAWDFTVDAGPASAGASPADTPQAPGQRGTDLVATLAQAAEAFPELGLADAGQAVLLVGGWRPPLVDRIVTASDEAPRPFLAGVRSVPGLYAFLLDVPALREASGT